MTKGLPRALRKILVAGVPMLAAQPLPAEPWACAFSVTCAVGQACAPVALDARIIIVDHEGRVFVQFDGTSYPATRIDTSNRRYVAQTDTAALLVTIDPGGATTLTRHAATTTSFFGSCEGE